MSKFKKIALVIVLAFIPLIFIGCIKKKEVQPVDLKFALAKTEETSKKIWFEIAREYKKKNPQVEIEFLGMEDYDYETSGLISLLTYKSPDIYFEWGGTRVSNQLKNGYAANLTDELKKNDWKNSFVEAAFDGTIIDNKNYMIPYNSQISNVFWYHRDIFNKLKIEIPANWDQFLEACEKIKNSGTIPLYIGNKNLWAGGNPMGHLISRIIGEGEYYKALQRERKFNEPDFLEAFQYIKVLWDRGYVNKDLNGLTAEQGIEGWLAKKGAIIPMGSWMLEFTGNAKMKESDFDFFNLPAIPGKKGVQTSIMGLNVGFMVNAKSTNIQESIKFLKYLTTKEISLKFKESGEFSLIKGVSQIQKAASSYAKLHKLLEQTNSVIAPPDTGFNLKVANAFYTAIAKVIGGADTAEASLKELDATVASLQD